MRNGSKRVLRTGILAGLAYAGWRAWQARVRAAGREISWEAAPFPFPPIPRPAQPETRRPDPFTDPDADGACPSTHPVKAKLASGIFHVPGGGNYERTRADRCYVDADAATADGLRPARR